MNDDVYYKEPDPKPGVTRVKWIRDGHPDEWLELHDYSSTATVEQKLRDGITAALKMLRGSQNDLCVVRAQDILKAALEKADGK